VARYKAIPSQKAEFDAFWDDLMTECGCSSPQKAELVRQSAEFRAKSAEFMACCQQEAKAGREPDEPLDAFKDRKLQSLDILAQTINELTE
jgi:hypothetical protein